MIMRRFLLFALLIIPIGCQVSQSNNNPNIVIIYTDDQGYGDVSALNPDARFQTPNIDKLAEEGVIFTDGHSSDGVCTPSRYTLLTGRYSWRTTLKKGVLRAEGPCLIEKDRLTIASLLRQQGYNTAMIGKWHLQMEFAGMIGKDRDWTKAFSDGPVEHGFDYFFGIPASMNYGVLTFLENDRVLDPPVLWTKKKQNPNPRSFHEAVSPADYRMTPPYQENQGEGNNWIEVAPSFNDELVLETFAEKAVNYINSVAQDARNGKPFFLYFALTSPHLPHCTHPEFQGRTNCGNYGDFMVETDFRVGQVLTALSEHGLKENTLVIFSSDNGAETNYDYWKEHFNHSSSMDFKGGKRDIYEGGHRVPFLMCWPKEIKAGSRVDLPVCQSDFMATIADIIGVRLPENAGEDSYSLFPLISKKALGEYPSERAIIHHSASGYFAIRKGKWKLNMLRGSGGSLEPRFIEINEGEAPYELYDLEIDNGETKNLYFAHPEIVKELEAEISGIIRSGRSTPGKAQEFVKENWEQINWMNL